VTVWVERQRPGRPGGWPWRSNGSGRTAGWPWRSNGSGPDGGRAGRPV